MPRATRGLSQGDSGHRQHRAVRRRVRRAKHLGEAVRAASALRARQARPRAAELGDRACWNWRNWPRRNGIGLTIDAEECDRLELSLDLIVRYSRMSRCGLERLTAGGAGLPETRAVRDRLSRADGTQASVGACRATGQGRVLGCRGQARPGRWLGRLPGVHPQARTPMSYLACARRMLDAATMPFYPMFATHNAHTISAIHHMARRCSRQSPVRRRASSSRSCTAWAMTCTRK
jgi:hypothetical protein